MERHVALKILVILATLTQSFRFITTFRLSLSQFLILKMMVLLWQLLTQLLQRLQQTLN
jgi:hypothetical protein